EIDVRIRQRLARGEHDDVEVGALEAAPGDLVANEERIVGAWRVGEGNGKRERPLVEIEIRLLGDVGILAQRRLAGEVTGANVARQQVRIESLKVVRAPEQV